MNNNLKPEASDSEKETPLCRMGVNLIAIEAADLAQSKSRKNKPAQKRFLVARSDSVELADEINQRFGRLTREGQFVFSANEQAKKDLILAIAAGDLDRVASFATKDTWPLGSWTANNWNVLAMTTLAQNFSQEALQLVWPLMDGGQKNIAESLGQAKFRGISLIRRLAALAENSPDPVGARAWLWSLGERMDDGLCAISYAAGVRGVLTTLDERSKTGRFAAGVALHDYPKEKSDLLRIGWRTIHRLENTRSAANIGDLLDQITLRAGVMALDANDQEGCSELLGERNFARFLAVLGHRVGRFDGMTLLALKTLDNILSQNSAAAAKFSEWDKQLDAGAFLSGRQADIRRRLQVEAQSNSKSIRVKGFALNALLFSPAGERMLLEPAIRKNVVDGWMATDGLENRLAAVSFLEISDLIDLIREHRDVLTEWRDDNGNNIFHYLVGGRSESRAALALAAEMDSELLTSPNNTGRAVVDFLTDRQRIVADQLILKQEVKNAGARRARKTGGRAL